jgi:hypothetical protein
MTLRETGRSAALGRTMKIYAVAAAVRGRDLGDPAAGRRGGAGAGRDLVDSPGLP